uniref:Uncharacterized protein n=1 Tax=Strigamia maritima TaxID=126957 RepID=T1IW04_STRMM
FQKRNIWRYVTIALIISFIAFYPMASQRQSNQ